MDLQRLECLQQELKASLADPARHAESITRCLELHALLHSAGVSGAAESTYEDALWQGLTDTMARAKPFKRDASIVWCLWHTSRIEDIVSNILFLDGRQIFDAAWQQRIGVPVVDTGNAMTAEAIAAFSDAVAVDALRSYRHAVGRNTRDIVQRLRPADMKRKASKASLQRVLDEGAVLAVQGAEWLIGFWGGKTIAGLLQVPITLHHTMHLKESLRVKTKLCTLQKKA